MRYISFIVAIGGLAVFPVFALAANEVSISGTHDWVLPSDGSQYTITGGTFDSVTISGGTFTFTMSGGSSIEILSSDKKKYTVSPSSLATHTCEASQSRLSLSKPTGGATETVTVTPSGTCSGSSSSSSSGGGSSGGGGGTAVGLFDPPKAPEGGFSVLINNNAAVSGSRKVVLSFRTGPDTGRMSLSNSLDFKDATQEASAPSKQWDICSENGGAVLMSQCPAGTYTVYAKFFSPNGQASAVVSDSIQYKPGAVPEVQMVSGSGFSRDIQTGSQGEDVRALQVFLNANGFLVASSGAGSPGNETDYFGNATKRALAKFQEANAKDILIPSGLSKGTGYFGARTRAFVNTFTKGASAPATSATSAQTVLVFTRSLRVGAQGDDVRRLQEFLASDSAIYPEGHVTGYFGALTKKAVGRFQEKYSIASPGEAGYGIVGPKTSAKLNELLGK